jgi:hypothetical protein
MLPIHIPWPTSTILCREGLNKEEGVKDRATVALLKPWQH